MAVFRANSLAGPVVAISQDPATTNGPAAPSGPTDTSVAVRPLAGYAAVGVVLAGIGLIVGLFLLGSKHPGLTNLPEVAAGTSTFAVIYVFAQAIERILVPVSWFGGGFWEGTTKKEVKQRQQFQMAKATASASQADAQDAANAAHDADQYRANLTATSFGVASLLAFIAVGYSGALFLHLAGIKAAGWLDLLVTGLAIAGGTKPLHDLIDNVSKASAAKSSGTS